jgi:PAS domain S-box-containing protein
MDCRSFILTLKEQVLKETQRALRMQIFYKRLGVFTGFLLLLLLLLAGMIATRRQLELQRQSQQRVLHSKQLMADLTATESLIKDAETGQRGYLLTNNPQYLDDYYAGVRQLPEELEQLDGLVSDDPAEEARARKLGDLVQRKLGELAHTVGLQKAGLHSEALALVNSDAGLHTMNSIRQQIEQMEQAEELLDEARDAAYERSRQSTLLSLYISFAVGVIGMLLLAYYITHEMTLRQRYSEQIEAREEQYRVTLTSLGDGVIATDASGHVTFLNPIAETLTGITMAQALGKSVHDIFPIFNEYTHEVVLNPVDKVMELGHVVGLANHTVLRNAQGALTPIEDSAAPIIDGKGKLLGVVLVFRDATAERKSQEILRKTEKLAAAARLAATVSHEINNPLEAIGNLVYLVKSMPDLPEEAQAPLEMTERELERVAHITRQTLGFYRESNVQEIVDLVAVIEYVLKLYSNKLHLKNLEIEKSFDACPMIYGKRGELTQAISNLISNAIDAARPNGAIRMELSSVHLEQNPEKPWARISIQDNGAGVPEALREKIFEPFFTTKKDVGTGLGLWLTKEILERHGGTIHIVPGVGRENAGAEFEILLPGTV